MDTESRSEPLNLEADDGSRGGARGELHDLPGPGQHVLSEYEEELPVYLDLLKDLPTTPSYDLPEDELRHMPEGNKDSAWQNCLNSVEKYDKELCQTYREQIDTLLVFAGLFSAVVTAFTVESYQWLQDDAQNPSVQLLQDMVTLLSRNLNVTTPPTPIASSRISGPAVARINTFWFLSLSLSLSAALVGILCKQWLREYERDVGQSPERALAVRHIRFQGFDYWKVGSIVMFVPILMQIALALFMIGVIELLWCLHVVVACCVTVVGGLTLIFFLATTFLPAIQYAYICIRCCVKPLKHPAYSTMNAFTEPQCAFKSPQAWLVFRIIQPLIERLLKAGRYQFSLRPPTRNMSVAMRAADSWVTFDLNWINRREHVHHGPRCAFESLAWIASNLGELHLSAWLWHCVWARWLRNRQNWDSITLAGTEIEAVARSYPSIVPLGHDNLPRIKVQALVFRCSLRADLPLETSIELFLRVAPLVGVHSRWTREAAYAIHAIYQDLSIHINDGLAVELFRLAEMQTHALILHPDGPNQASQLNAALAFKNVVLIIYRGSRLREPLLMALGGLVLQWLRSNPPAQIVHVANLIFENMLIHLGRRARRGADLRKIPGIILLAKLAGTLSHSWPELARDRSEIERRYPRVMPDLLPMLSDESLEPPQGGGTILPPSGPVRDVDGGRSTELVVDSDINAPSDKEAHTVIDDPVSHAGETSHGPVHARLCIDVRAEAEQDAVEVEDGLNCAASPVTGRILPSPAERSPVSHNSISSPSK